MGVTRTSEPLTVSDEELDRAIAVVEELLREEGLEADLWVEVRTDPEDADVEPVTVLLARVPESESPKKIVTVMENGWDRLRAQGIGYPFRPLLFGVGSRGGT